LDCIIKEGREQIEQSLLIMSEQPLHHTITQQLFSEAIPTASEAFFLENLIQRNIITVFILTHPESLERAIQEHLAEQEQVVYHNQPELVPELSRIIGELQKMKFPVPVIMKSLLLYCALTTQTFSDNTE
jgi:hypothetical protein